MYADHLQRLEASRDRTLGSVDITLDDVNVTEDGLPPMEEEEDDRASKRARVGVYPIPLGS